MSPGAFGPTSTVINFAGLSDGTDVNGLLVGGVAFSYSLGSGLVIIDGGPGITGNIAPPNIVSTGNPGGVLELTLPGLFDTFGYGFALLSDASVANATAVTLFSGATNVGSLSFSGAPDPAFTGGFAGVQSTIPFDRVTLTFNSTVAPAFAVDNVRLTSGIPEPGTFALLGAGIAAVLFRRATRRR